MSKHRIYVKSYLYVYQGRIRFALRGTRHVIYCLGVQELENPLYDLFEPFLEILNDRGGLSTVVDPTVKNLYLTVGHTVLREIEDHVPCDSTIDNTITYHGHTDG